MSFPAFDTLKAANRLREAGFDEKQAQELVSTFAEGVGENVAAKGDLENVEGRLNGKMDHLESRLRGEMREMEQRMTIKLGGIMVAGTGFMVVLDRLFPAGSGIN